MHFSLTSLKKKCEGTGNGQKNFMGEGVKGGKGTTPIKLKVKSVEKLLLPTRIYKEQQEQTSKPVRIEESIILHPLSPLASLRHPSTLVPSLKKKTSPNDSHATLSIT